MSQPPSPALRPLSLQALHPSNFALVMVTGIIALGLQLLHYEGIGAVRRALALAA